MERLGDSLTYEKNKNNQLKNLENYESILILVVQDDFYNFLTVANIVEWPFLYH